MDPKTGDLVVSYPENIYSPSWKEHPGPLHTEVVKLGDQVEPEVIVDVHQDESGIYRYRYTVTNGGSARQPIREWHVVLPSSDLVQTLQDARFWFHMAPSMTPGDPRALAYLNPPGFWMTWLSVGRDEVRGTPEGAGDITAGSAAVFGIDGRGKPGFALNLFDDGDPAIAGELGDQPEPVYEEIRSLMLLGGISQQRWFLGPVFEPDASSEYVARDLSCAVRLLVRNHQLDANSRFVQEAEETLRQYAAGSAAAGQPLKGSAIEFRNKPATEMERQLGLAITMSL
ncbi:MAG TPA: hypothetical protein VMT20_14380 [Terriglobia bacterium]|nr:hypothetical protein [Terriglobia bacterium]